MRRGVVLLAAALLVLAGCTAASMTKEQKQFVKSSYKHRKRYMNAVVYSNDLGPDTTGRPSGGQIWRYQNYKATDAAVWLTTEKRLTIYSKLFYSHDKGTGNISVWQEGSVEKKPTTEAAGKKEKSE